MWDYLFEFNELSDNEGEQFFVECENLEVAFEIIDDNFERSVVTYLGKFNPTEAEILGLDTY